jgi:hypothetical protein
MNEEPKKTSASQDYSAAVAANPAVFYKKSGRPFQSAPTADRDPLVEQRHQAFVENHPLAKE